MLSRCFRLWVIVGFLFFAEKVPPFLLPPAPAAVSGPTLILNEISPFAQDNTCWLEILNTCNRPVSTEGWRVTFFSGYALDLAERFPECPADGVVLVRFDGSRLSPDGDGCVLSSSDGPVDAISWLDPPVAAESGISPGAPLCPPFRILHDGESASQAGDVLIRLPETYPPTQENWLGSDNWVYRGPDSASPSEPNPFPPPVRVSPEDGAVLASDFTLYATGVEWAQEITFQVARDETFRDLIVEETTEKPFMPMVNLEPGTYFWRIRAGRTGGWSPPFQFTRAAFDIEELISESSRSNKAEGSKGGGIPEGFTVPTGGTLTAGRVLGVPLISQRKDSNMICMDGCDEQGVCAWNQPHPDGMMSGGHNDHYCTRACLAMISMYGGGSICQDRITHYMFEELGSASRCARDSRHIGDPFGDLGHSKPAYGRDACLTMDWLYGQPQGSSLERVYSADVFDDSDRSDMDSIREFIDDSRPVLKHTEHHSTLVDGYAVVRLDSGSEEWFIHVLDPWALGSETWESLPRTRSGLWFGFPPAAGTPSRPQEPEIDRDSDGDRLVDFDEIHRLHTDPHQQDTDGDGVDDYHDILGYLFDRDTIYHRRERDYDRDGQPKELDPDNDRSENDGVTDGCEDTNHDGYFTPGGRESDCFSSDDDFTVLSPECFTGRLTIESRVTLAQPGVSVPVTTHEEILIEANGSLEAGEFVHQHTWRITGASTLDMGPHLGTITSSLHGEGETLASVHVEVDESGHYRITTDTRPREVSYTVTTDSPLGRRVNTYPFFLGFADHHFGYVSPEAPPFVWNMLQEAGPPNIFEGELETTGDGGVRAAGESTYSVEIPPNISGTLVRTWEIWLTPPQNPG